MTIEASLELMAFLSGDANQHIADELSQIDSLLNEAIVATSPSSNPSLQIVTAALTSFRAKGFINILDLLQKS
jgi:hypothetical protein